MRTNVHVLGGEQTDYQRNWSKEGKSITAMFKEVVEDGLASVGIDYSEIKKLSRKNRIGLFIGNFAAELYLKQGHLGAFLTEIDPVFYGIPGARYEAACASGSVALDAANAKIRSGDIDLALVIGIEMMKTVPPLQGGDYLGSAAHYEKEANGIEFPFPKLFGNLADKLMKKYNLDETTFMDDLAEISFINYSNAKNNPKAQTRNWFMNKEQAIRRNDDFNPSIGGRLCITDCSQVTDGAAMVVLASDNYVMDYAKKRKIKTIPRIKGSGFRIAPIIFSSKIIESRDNKYILPWTKKAIDDAYRSSGLDIDSIDVIETHDCFTSSEYMAISHLGLCEPGKEHKIIAKGVISFNGTKPINPGGGLIGIGHPVGATGVRMMLDLYKQVTNKAGSYQVPKAKNGLMLNLGGTATTSITFIIGI